MKIPSMIAIYFVIWWITLFAVLPFGIRNSAEAGKDVPEGHDKGAPVATGLLWKVGVTTVLAGLVFAVVYAVVRSGVLTR